MLPSFNDTGDHDDNNTESSSHLGRETEVSSLKHVLMGGVILLALEHVQHGEVKPWPPFLTAMANPVDAPVMLHEMATVGTAMSLATFVTWGTILTITHFMSKQQH